ncbi:MAG TPA: sulfatase, partial [Terriglobales bacterium]|nr:sulfatase [Terriglobales bacterium]
MSLFNMTSSGAARGALFLALIALAGCRSEVPSGKRPAVVIAMIDTLRADYVGAYGFAGPISPAIDRIAAEGVVFESCSAPAPWTKPSIASLFSGLEPEVHQVLTEQGKYRERGKAGESERFNVLADDIDTLAEAFQSAGYRTAAFVANPWIRPELGFAQGFDEFHGDENAAQAEPGTKFPGGVVLDQLRDFLVRRPQEKPVLLYLHFMEVHGPYDAPEEDYRAIVSSDSLGPPQPLLPVRFKLMPPYLRTASWVDEAEAKDVRTWRARYAAGVRVVDRHIATLRQQLEQAGIWDDAIVVVTSDHGEQLYDHQGWDHGYSL